MEEEIIKGYGRRLSEAYYKEPRDNGDHSENFEEDFNKDDLLKLM